jgi:8-oxo-dGTP pyrophosphatase MutT (NUDIX family)
MQAFIRENYRFVAGCLQSLEHKGDVSSVHLAIGWKYVGRQHPELINQYVLAVAFDRFKGQWDFPGGKFDNPKIRDPAEQFLTTMYKELYEELAVTVIVPLETFVLEIIQCGWTKTSYLVVCGIKGLVADRFRNEMQKKITIRPRLPTCFTEMSDFRYLGSRDTRTLQRSTGYVQEQHDRALHVVRTSTADFPPFDAVMRIGKR